MKRQNEVKLNSFSGTSQVAITGRYGFSQDTDTDITRSYDVEVLRYQDDEQEDYYRNADLRMPEIQRWGGVPLATERSYDGYNMPLAAVDFTVNIPNGSVMKQIKSLDFRPSAASNSLPCYPVLQRRIIPYLCPPQTIENVETSYQTSATATAADVSNSRGPPPDEVEWDPRYQGHFVITQLAQADVLNNAFSFDGVGVIPTDAVDFSYDNFDANGPYPDGRKTLKLQYVQATDSYVFNGDSDLIVRIAATSFKNTHNIGGGPAFAHLGGGDFHFAIDNAAVAAP